LGATFTRFKFSAMANLPCPVVGAGYIIAAPEKRSFCLWGLCRNRHGGGRRPQVAPGARGVVPLPALHYGFKTEIAADAPACQARGHQKGRIMKLKLMLTAAVIMALPLAAQAQKKPTKADADKVVKLISADKAKTKTYCDLAKLGDEAQQADEKKDTKKAEEIGKKMDAMGKQLGPEYAALMDSMQNLNEKEADAIGKAMEPLDKLCGK
jgi:hypothetical protein